MTISDRALQLMADGAGERALAREMNITRHQARNLMRDADKAKAASGALVEPDPHTPEEYAARITACWRKSAEAFIDAGRWLIRAKKELEHGEFGKMIAGALPFGASTAQRLMIVAADSWIANPAHVQHLPPHWGTLYEITKLPETRRDELLAAGTIRSDMERSAISGEIKRQQRENRERVLGGILHALPSKKYGVILADPEWRFEPWSRETGLDRAADNHYPTSCTEVIAARDVPSIAANDCVLFLWATVPMLPHALLVMAAWGFDYRSNFSWTKDQLGTGYWNRNQHEHLLIGVRGNPPAPAPGTRERSVIEAPRGEHSAKPEIVLDYIEGWYPTLPKIELNRRGPPRPGWDAWGNEAEQISSGPLRAPPAPPAPSAPDTPPEDSGAA